MTDVALNDADKNRGRQRAQRLFEVSACTTCGRDDVRLERHHRDDNPLNNDPDNVRILCTRCHMAEDGRLAASQDKCRQIQPLAAAARRKWIGLTCSVEACDEPAKYKGLCNAHYYRARNNGGDPGTAPVRSYRRSE